MSLRSLITSIVTMLLLCLAGTLTWAGAPVATRTNPIDGAEMVLVPAGQFTMGTTEEALAGYLKANPELVREFFVDELPQHEVQMDTYYIYKNEVTVAQYRKFCAATGYTMPSEPAWKWQENQPIVNVSWDDAKAYATWAGATLPTEAQWEKAARGTDGRIYPWGKTWDASKARSSTKTFNDAQRPADVGSYPTGASPYGCQDMTGNVWEWCNDLYAAGYYRNSPAVNPTGPTKGSTYILRGGSWGDFNPNYFRSTFRPSRDSTARYNDCGFRCVPLPAMKVNPKDDAEMMLVPAGAYMMGTSEGELAALLRANPKLKREEFAGEMPQHKVQLESFYIYKNEVTVAQYRKFCAATGLNMPPEPEWKWQDNQPIVNVSWNDAKAYASWAGMALPTEAQWEKAARGTDGRIFPWGNAWDSSKLQSSNIVAATQTASVGSFPAGASPYGCQDMAGNVWEWCNDFYGADYYQSSPPNNPYGPASGTARVLRGGSLAENNQNNFRTSYRAFYDPSSKLNMAGFRCVTLPTFKINPKDNAEMVWVPGSTFTMGSATRVSEGEGGDEGNPELAHQVTLSSYWIYKYDVTVAQYRAFCVATTRTLPEFPNNELSWKGKTGWDDPALQQHPIVNVSWNDAKAYANWAGVRLLTEAQWEYAARGQQGRNYPWGGKATKNDEENGWNATKCANNLNSFNVGKSTWPVGSFPDGASWCGAQDMTGNVWQWCGDWYGAYTAVAVTDPTGPATGDWRVLRGCSWDGNDCGSYQSALRISDAPDGCSESVGFRCATLSPGP